MLSGRVCVDLRESEPDRAPARLACLATLPPGVRVDVLVGPLKANPGACRTLAAHAQRLDVDIVGQPRAVIEWLQLVREPDVLAWNTP